MLLARVTHDRAVLRGTPLRGLFAPDDAWLATGALFRRDTDGDHWLVDEVSALIRTADGVIPSIPIEDALGALDAVDLAVAYGVPIQPGGTELAVAAVTLREGHELDPEELATSLAYLGPGRPDVIRVVKEIPLTTWYRPIKPLLRQEGIPRGEGPAWYLDRATGAYRQLDDKAAKRLLDGASWKK
jgi:putative long chain acyl-CoA synthase